MAGRKTKLTPAIQARIVEVIAAGNYLETAAAHAGINKQTLHKWLSWGERQGRGLYKQFAEAVRKAQADSETRDVLLISKAAQEGAWQAAAWMLERKHPARWARRDRLDVNASGSIVHTHLTRSDLAKLSDDELKVMESIYAKLLPPPAPDADAPGAGPDDDPGGEGEA